ncbi:MAG: hypothetical protein L0387_11465, partial [Acidobacteria bacterium]|nr:hypothetical protein [Acidobacteriota bacterium]MCI0718067.1 hypothetical protein [Acidobacteriota bacterium]
MSQRWVTLACYAGLLLSSIWSLRGTSAQVFPRAEIIWYDEGDPLQSAPAETRYFRRTFEERHDLAEAEMYIACNDEFVLHINGKEVGRGRNWQQGKVFDVKGWLRRGKNLITVEAINRGGPAGLVAWLVRRTIPGNHYTLLTDSSWKCSKEAPQNWRELDFDDSQWAAAKVLGQFGKAGLWPEVTWNEGKSNPGRFRAKPGFMIDVVAEPELTGSIVAMTFDTKGRPVISRENGPVLILEDTNGDGKFDHAKEYTRKVTNCQGILAYDERTYYLVGNGPQADGLYRLKDLDGDDSADQVELIHKFRGRMSEHGPHAIVAGPDGFLYLVMGNMAWVTATPERNSPVE